MSIRLFTASPRRPGLAWLLLLLATGPGCAVLNVQQPTASLRLAKVTGLSPSGLTASFDINVHDPNSFDLPVNAAAYKLSLSGVQVVEGHVEPTGSVPADGELTVAVPVHLRFDQLLLAKKEIAASGGNVPFVFDGSLELSPGKFPIGKTIEVPLHFSGTLSLRDAASTAIRDAADRADLLRDPWARKFLESALGFKLIGGILDR